MVRAAGGLCIADEVQTGFGRTGSNYWGFQNQVRHFISLHGLTGLVVNRLSSTPVDCSDLLKTCKDMDSTLTCVSLLLACAHRV